MDFSRYPRPAFRGVDLGDGLSFKTDVARASTRDAIGLTQTDQDMQQRALTSEFVSVSQFRKDTDSDDTASWERARDTRRCVRVPWRAEPYVINTNTIIVDTGQQIVGEAIGDIRPSIKSNLPAIFRYVGQGYHGVVGFDVDMTGAPPGSTIVRYGTSSGLVVQSFVRNIYGYNCYSIVDDELHPTNYAAYAYWTELRSVMKRARSFLNRRSRGFFILDGVNVDHAFTQSAVTWEGMRFQDPAGLIIKGAGIEVGGSNASGNAAYQAAAFGVVISGVPGIVSSVDITGRAAVDSVNGPGILFQDVDSLHLRGKIESYAALGRNIDFTRCSRVYGAVHVSGARGKANAVGEALVTLTNVARSQLQIAANNGPANGVTLLNSLDNRLDVSAFNNVGRGLVESDGCDRNVFSGNFGAPSATGQGNAAGSVYLTGSNSILLPCQTNNGGSAGIASGTARPAAV